MAKINGTNGDDGFWGTERADQIKLFGGNDWADGGAGNDSIGGGTGNDYLSGEAGNDRIWGAEGNDSLFGHSNIIDGRGEADYLSGGPGNDYIGLYYGAGGHAIGGSGNDSIVHYGFGAARADGGTGDDYILNDNGISTGGAGNDRLEAWLYDPSYDNDGPIPGTGHAAVDMTGGSGADIFMVTGDSRWQGNTAEIRDFRADQGDRIGLGIAGEGYRLWTGDVFVGLDANHDNQLTGADFASGGAVYDDGSGLLIGLNGNLLHLANVHALDWGMVV